MLWSETSIRLRKAEQELAKLEVGKVLIPVISDEVNNRTVLDLVESVLSDNSQREVDEDAVVRHSECIASKFSNSINSIYSQQEEV